MRVHVVRLRPNLKGGDLEKATAYLVCAKREYSRKSAERSDFPLGRFNGWTWRRKIVGADIQRIRMRESRSLIPGIIACKGVMRNTTWETSRDNP